MKLTMRQINQHKNLLRILTISVFLAMTGYMAAAYASMHIHILPDGIVITHSHPNNDDNSGNSKNGHHRHSNNEYILISHFSTFLNNIIIVIIILFVIYKIIFTFLFISKLALVEYSYFDCYGRAPPYIFS